MEPILAFLIAFYVVAFMYDKTIDSQIKSPKALSAALGFKFLGISTTLTIIGCTFAIMMYLGLGLGAYLLLR